MNEYGWAYGALSAVGVINAVSAVNYYFFQNQTHPAAANVVLAFTAAALALHIRHEQKKADRSVSRQALGNDFGRGGPDL